MAVKITEDMYDTFINNGYTEDDIKNTVNHYREQGMPDSAIFTNMNKKYRDLANIKDVVTPQVNEPIDNSSNTLQGYANKIEDAGKSLVKNSANTIGDFSKGLAQGVSSLGVGLGRQFANPIREAIGKQPLTPEQLNNTYGFLGQKPTSFAGQVGKGIGEIAPYMLLPEVTPFKGAGLAPSLGNMAATGAYQGGLANTLNSFVNNGINPAQNLKDLTIGAGGGALLNTAFGSALKYGLPKVAPKVFSNTVEDITPVVSNERPIGLSRLPKEIVPLAEAPTVGEAPIQQVTPNKFAIEADTDIVQPAQTVEQPNVGTIEQPVPEMVQPLNKQALQKDLNVGLQAVEEPTITPRQEPVKKGYVRLYRGLTNEFDPKYNKSRLDNTNGYESWTDNYDLAKAYGDKVYQIDVPKSKIASAVIDEDPKSMTYGDRNLLYKNDKPVGIKGKSGNEYMLYTAHDDYDTLKYIKSEPEQPVPEMVQPLNKQALQKDLNVELRALRNSIELPEVTKGTYIKGRYKNRFFTKDITDDLTREFIDADKALLEVTKEIKNNPANALQNMDILENKLIDKVGKLPDEAQQKYYDKFYKDLDIANTHEELSKKALTPEGAGFIADDVINSKQKVTKLSQSILKAKGLPTDIKKTIKQNAPTYESMTNNDLITTASDAIDKDLMGNLADIMAKDKFNAFDVERTRQIAKRLNAQNTPEANETLVNLLDKASEQASKSGQAVQAFSLWNNLTPEGAILKTNKLLNEYNKRFGKNLKLTQEQINNITKLQETAQALPDGYDKDVALAKSLKYQQSIIPKSLGSKIKAYRNISLLLNPKTLGRNVVGNALFNTIDTASKTLAVPIDKAMGAFTKTHTRAMPQIGESLKGLKLGAERGFKEAMQGINTADVSSRYDLQGGKVFESKVGQAFETALDLGLRVPDRAFYNSVYAESLANQLKASGLKEPTTKMIEQAEKEALEGVFQNKSKLSDIALGLRQQFNRVGTKEFGLGDLLIPYAQTPANLAQQGINYSPLGLLKAGASLKGGNQRQASLDVARALVGTGIGAAGYNAVKSGQATGSLETGKGYQQDLRLKKNMELLGIRPQQVGDISYSQFQPASIPFAVGAASATGESPTQAGINTLLDLPFLQNYNKMMSDIKDKGLAQAGANFVASIPSQFVPTVLGQINQTFDNTVRETYSPNKLQQGLNVAGAKIPFVAQTLPERVNVKGEPIQRYESTGVTRFGDIFLNPTFINKKKNDVVIKEMNKLYNETGEIAPLLPVAQRTIKVNGEQKKLTGKEVNQYQKEVGKISYYLRKKAIESDDFKSMNSDEKIDYLNKMNRGVTQAVKIMMFNDNPKKIQPFAQQIIDNYDTFTK